MDQAIETAGASHDGAADEPFRETDLQQRKRAILEEGDCRSSPGIMPGPRKPPAGEPESLLFDQEFYRWRYPDVSRAGHGPVTHYRLHGAAEGRWPNPYFDTAWYAGTIDAPGMNPFLHYVLYGYREGRAPRAPGVGPLLVGGGTSKGSSFSEEEEAKRL